MATEPLVLRILDNAEQALRGINGLDPYHFNVTRVTRLQLTATSPSTYPTLEISWSGDAPVSGTAWGAEDLYEANLEFVVVGWIRSEQPQEDGARLEMDVKTAIEADGTRGGLALDTAWLITQFLLVPDSAKGLAQVQLGYRVRYQVLRTDFGRPS